MNTLIVTTGGYYCYSCMSFYTFFEIDKLPYFHPVELPEYASFES